MEQKIKSTLSTLSTFKKSGAKINPLYPLLGKVIRSEEQKINFTDYHDKIEVKDVKMLRFE